MQIFSFLGSFWGPWGQLKKRPEISTNTYRTELNLCELNSMGNTLKLNIKLVLGKFCKKTVCFKYFPFPYIKYGRKIINSQKYIFKLYF